MEWLFVAARTQPRLGEVLSTALAKTEATSA